MFVIQSSPDLQKWTAFTGPNTSDVQIPIKMADSGFFRSVESPDLSSTPFEFSTFGTNISFSDGYIISHDGNVLRVPAQSLAVRLSATNYLGVDLFDLSMHAYSRAIDMGTLFLKQVICDNSGIIQVVDISRGLEVPANRCESVKLRLLDGNTTVRIAALGDSLSLPYPGYQTNWFDALFYNPAYLSNAFLPHTVFWQPRNFSVGTQSSIHGMAMIGRSVFTVPGDSGGDTGFSSILYPEFSPYADGQAGESPILAGGLDLLFVGYYNDSIYKLSYLERLVQNARERGISVILHTAEGADAVSATDHMSEGPIIRRIADQHGAMLIDTWARMEEAIQIKHLNAKVDGLHQNDRGHQLWARWFRAALPTYSQPIESIPVSSVLVAPPYLPSGFSFPKEIELNFSFPSTISYPTNLAQIYTYYRNPALSIGGRGATNAVVVLPGGTATMANPHALTFDILVDGTSPFNVTVSCGSFTVKTVTFSGFGPRIGVVQLLSLADIQNIPASVYQYGKPQFFDNLTLTLTVNSGRMVLVGGMWGVPNYKEVNLKDFEFDGIGWSGVDLGLVQGTKIVANNTIGGGSFSLPFTGGGVGVLFQGSPVGGKIALYLDGQLNQTIDTYSPGNRFIPVNLFPDGTPDVTTSDQHSVSGKLLTDRNPLAVAPTNGMPVYGIISAYNFSPPR